MEFEKRGKHLILLYTADRNGSVWIYKRLETDGKVTIAKRFQFEREDLITVQREEPDSEFDPVEFVLGSIKGKYYSIKTRVLGLKNPLYISKNIKFSRKLFLAERDISILGRIDSLSSEAVYIGGAHSTAIPEAEFERLLLYFPTSNELTRYSQARITQILGEYLSPKEDYFEKFQRARNQRGDLLIETVAPAVAEFETYKFETISRKLKGMLNDEEPYSEKRWQTEIVDILQILNPKYIGAFPEPPIHDSYSGVTRRVDFLLVDAGGSIDLAEIKKPADSAVVTRGTYRGNHIPMKELSGSIMQLEKYILYLNRWGVDGENKLTHRYADRLPPGMKIRITNPGGIVIAGRSHNLSEQQRLDFEVIRRKYKNLIDIVTYDDLINRLERIVEHWRSHT